LIVEPPTPGDDFFLGSFEELGGRDCTGNETPAGVTLSVCLSWVGKTQLGAQEEEELPKAAANNRSQTAGPTARIVFLSLGCHGNLGNFWSNLPFHKINAGIFCISFVHYWFGHLVLDIFPILFEIRCLKRLMLPHPSRTS